jgi:hypothetical protein
MTRASRVNCSLGPECPANRGARTLSATVRFSRVSHARYTSPIPPAPLGPFAMNTARWLRIKRLFDATVDLTPCDRTAFLLEACVGDSALQQEVELLLASYHRSGNFLETPAMVRGSGFLSIACWKAWSAPAQSQS